MRKLTKFYELLLAGIVTAVVYGLLARYLFGKTNQIASLTFFFVVPALLGYLPLLFVSKELLQKRWVVFVSPAVTILVFCIVMFLLGIENVLCLLILLAPFLLLSVIGAWVGSVVYRRIRLNRERKQQDLLVLAIIPFLVAPLEALIKSPTQTWGMESWVVIDALPQTVWKNIVAVPTIKQHEYKAGFFNRLGVPRPLRASVDLWAKGGHRTGEFDGGLTIREVITEYNENKKISFAITIDTATVGNDVFQQHVLKGAYFSFVDAAYSLQPLSGGRTKLVLSSGYRLTSKFNFYGRWWGDKILSDFQSRLLEVIKNRCEGESQRTVLY
ncbi:MAG TPA: hypothetical protein VER36_12620 [Flavisolibacter sp.]|nr:hypothetical protein [Flavisolibacter sp.]